MKGYLIVLGCILSWPLVAEAGVSAVTGITPTGTSLTGIQNVTSITANSVTYNALTGPDNSQDSSALGASLSTGHPALSPNISEQALIGLDMGAADLGPGAGTGAQYCAVWFPTPIHAANFNNPDAEFFVLEWAGSTDRFILDLLTSAPGTGASPTIAASIQVLASDYTGLATTRVSTVSFGVQSIGGVAINIDDLGLSPSTLITGLRVANDDGAGGRTGLDPCVFAMNVPEPATAMLLLGALPLLRRRN